MDCARTVIGLGGASPGGAAMVSQIIAHLQVCPMFYMHCLVVERRPFGGRLLFAMGGELHCQLAGSVAALRQSLHRSHNEELPWPASTAAAHHSRPPLTLKPRATGIVSTSFSALIAVRRVRSCRPQPTTAL